MPTALSDRGLKGCRSGGKTNAPPRRAFEGMRVGKGRAGHWSVRHVPCSFSRSPLTSPGGGIPARHPIRRKQGPRQGIPLLQPCHGPCILPSALRQGRRRPFPLPQGPAPPLLILARCFISRPQALISPARWLPLHRFTDLFGWRPALQSPGSRHGVAPCRLGAPPAAPFSPALPRGCHRPSGPGCAPPLRPLGIRARPPRRGSLPASGAGLTTAARRQARPSGILYFSFARSRQTSLRSDCRSSGVSAGSATA